MWTGQKEHGIFEPGLDNADWAKNGAEEAADSDNYAQMEKADVLVHTGKLGEQEIEELILVVDDIRALSIELGKRWHQYMELREMKLEVGGK